MVPVQAPRHSARSGTRLPQPARAHFPIIRQNLHVAARRGVPFICLDDIWQPSWIAADTPRFRELIAAVHAGDAWISDGNFAAVTAIVCRDAGIKLAAQVLIYAATDLASVGDPDIRKAYFGDHGWLETPVVSRADLATARSGPLIVEEYDSTCVVPPGARAERDAAGNIVITL